MNVPWVWITRECLDNKESYPLCTIAETPRLPQHCIQYALVILWEKSFSRPVDKDSVEDVQWLYETALKRAESYGIEGVTYELTLGVIKNIIPAIASTNAIIAASTVLETVKALSLCSKLLNNNMTFFGHEGILSTSFVLEKSPRCSSCNEVLVYKLSQKTLLGEFIEMLKEELNLLEPSLFNKITGYVLFARNSPESAPNLERSLGQLIEQGVLKKKSKIDIDDKNLKSTRRIQLTIA